MRTTQRGPVIAFALALALYGCATDSAPDEQTSAPRAVIVDTDAGQDDAIALLYLATSPSVDLRAVTVSGTGLAHCFPGARNVVGLLELAGRTDVPVACGPEEPLGAGDAFHPFPDQWRRIADGRFGDAWRIGRGSLDERQAPELLVESVDRGETPVTLVTLGPLTNVAAALALDDRFAAGVDRVVAMGGAFEVPGNTAGAEPPPPRNVAEWNIYADPQAAQDVVKSGLLMRFVPLDATNSVPLDVYVLQAAALAPETDLLRVVSNLLSGLRGMISAGEYYLWDPLAAVLTVQPAFGTLEERAIDVVTAGPDAGRTIEKAETAGGAQVEVFIVADGRGAETALLEGLAGAPMARIDETPDLVIDAEACTAAGDDLIAGPRVLHVEPADASSSETSGVAIGTLAAGRGMADIEAFFAAPTAEPPEWFTLTATLGGSVNAPSTDLVWLVSGDYTVVCISLEQSTPALAGTTVFTVRQ
jgi:pyrimidine-specific ribonucleoside hydrolase